MIFLLLAVVVVVVAAVNLFAGALRLTKELI